MVSRRGSWPPKGNTQSSLSPAGIPLGRQQLGRTVVAYRHDLVFRLVPLPFRLTIASWVHTLVAVIYGSVIGAVVSLW